MNIDESRNRKHWRCPIRADAPLLQASGSRPYYFRFLPLRTARLRWPYCSREVRMFCAEAECTSPSSCPHTSMQKLILLSINAPQQENTRGKSNNSSSISYRSMNCTRKSSHCLLCWQSASSSGLRLRTSSPFASFRWCTGEPKSTTSSHSSLLHSLAEATAAGESSSAGGEHAAGESASACGEAASAESSERRRNRRCWRR